MANSIVLEVLLDYSKVKKQARQIKAALDKGINGKAGTDNIKKTNKEIAKTSGLMKMLGFHSNNVGMEVGSIFAKFGLWAGVSTIIFGVVRGIQAFFGAIRELEDATIRLTRVMSGNNSQIKSNIQSTIQFATELNALTSVSFKQSIDAMTEATKAGFNLADAMLIAKSSLIAVNVTELDQAEATKYMIATLRQFNLEALDSMQILDKWNELGKRTGATSLDIAEAVTRSGKAFKAVGGTLAQLTAIAAVTIEATGESGAKIGTMLKTLSARYTDMEKRLSVANKLNAIGIDIYDEQTGKLKPLIDSIGELSAKWDTLTDAQRAAIAKAFAGVRQYSRFLGTVENFDKVMQATAISIDSNGSALAENRKRMNSLSFAIGRLGGEWDELVSGPLGEFILLISKGVINTFITAIDSLNISIVALSNSFKQLGKFSNNVVKNLLEDIKSLTDNSLRIPNISNIILDTVVKKWEDAKRKVDKAVKSTSTDTSFNEEYINGLITSRVELSKLAKKQAETFATTGSYTVRSDILTMFKNISPELEAMVKKLDIMTIGTKMFKDQLELIQKEANSLITPMSQLELITTKMSVSKTTKTLLSDILNSDNIPKRINEIRTLGDEFDSMLKIPDIDKNDIITLLASSSLDFEKYITQLQNTGDTSEEVFEKLKKTAIDYFKSVKLLNVGEDNKIIPTIDFDTDAQGKIMAKWLKFQLKAIETLDDEIRKSNKTLISASISPLFEEGDLIDRIGNALKGLNNIVIDTFKNGVIDGIVEGMMASAPLKAIESTVSKFTTGIIDSFALSTAGTAGGTAVGASVGAGAGAAGAAATAGAINPAFLALMAGSFILSSILGNSSEKTTEDNNRAEQLKISKESNKHLQVVSRNTTVMAREMRNFAIFNESRFFAIANNRGLAGGI